MKKLLMVLFLGLLTVTLAACGGIKGDIKGTYASENQVIVVDKDKYTMYDKGEPEKPVGVYFYKVVNADNGLNKMTVDISDEEDGEVYTRETWYKQGDEVIMLMDDGGEFSAFPEDDLGDYKSADPEDVD
ncbi:hypothetical protein CPT_Machias_227 [Staphylococcus phage Machias]|nr:hypothetical protein CPT_Machias_227 [Staphylococcus phage Machias]